jgi:hypothetical protein
MTRLKQMFLLLGFVGGGLVGYFQLVTLRNEYEPGDAIDAGLLAVTNPARLSCRVRILDRCRDGGTARPKYARVQLKARKSKPALGEDFVAIDVPNEWRTCMRLLGTAEEACDVLEEGACTVPAVCAANAEPQVETDACACKPLAGVCTRIDGGVAPLGATLAAGTWTGAACVRKFCGPEIAGEQGQSWPAGCPGG